MNSGNPLAMQAGDADGAAAGIPPAREAASARGRASAAALVPAITTLVLLGAWEALSRLGVFPAELPPVSDVLSWLWGHIGTSALLTSIRQTLIHWALGLLLGAAAGVLVGLAMGAVPVLNELLQGSLDFLRPIPAVVYLPLVLLLLGATSQVAIYLAALGAFWPLLFQTFYGVKDIDPMVRDTARVFGLTAAQRQLWVTLPSVLPYVATGVRIASAIALVVSIAMELIGGIAGLGAALAQYSNNGLYDAMYGVIVIAGLLGVILNTTLERLERSLLKWHPAHRAVSR